MKTDFIPVKDIFDLEKEIGYEITIHERPVKCRKSDLERFYACFDNAEIKKGKMLSGDVGNGGSPLMAVIRYCQNISNKTLVFHTKEKGRQELELSYFVIVNRESIERIQQFETN